MKISKELVKGSTAMMVLKQLSLQPMHGYQVMQRIAALSGDVFVFKEGTLYPLLHSLEAAGYISAAWDDSSGRKRKVYSITPAGTQSLEEREKEFGFFVQSVDSVMKGGAAHVARA